MKYYDHLDKLAGIDENDRDFIELEIKGSLLRFHAVSIESGHSLCITLDAWNMSLILVEIMRYLNGRGLAMLIDKKDTYRDCDTDPDR